MDGFDWDRGNQEKNWLKHKVSIKEAESIFLDKKILIISDPKHSTLEPRYVAHGESKKRRRLTVVFTIRKRLIRVISARDQSKRERKEYEKNK